MSQSAVGQDWHTANKARSGLTPSSSEGIPSKVVAAPGLKSVTGLRRFLIAALGHYS